MCVCEREIVCARAWDARECLGPLGWPQPVYDSPYQSTFDAVYVHGWSSPSSPPIIMHAVPDPSLRSTDGPGPHRMSPAPNGVLCVGRDNPPRDHTERLVIYCQTTGVSAAPATRIVPHTVPRAGRSYEHFPDGFKLHLLPRPHTHRHRRC